MRGVSEGAGRLTAGQLGTADLTASTLAKIGLGENFQVALAVVAGASAVAFITVRRHPYTGAGEGIGFSE